MSDQHEKELHVEVSVASIKEPKTFKWPSSENVGAAADQVAKTFGVKTDPPPTFQNSHDVVFSRNKTLGEEGVKDGDKLELVVTGGGV